MPSAKSWSVSLVPSTHSLPEHEMSGFIAGPNRPQESERLTGRACTLRHASVERLWVQIPLSPPAGPSCHRCAPTCLETESNLAPHMAASPLRHVISQCVSTWDSLSILTLFLIATAISYNMYNICNGLLSLTSAVVSNSSQFSVNDCAILIVRK